MKLSLVAFCFCLFTIAFCSIAFGETIPSAESAQATLSLQELAVLSEDAVVARVGASSPLPAANGGSLALWIQRVLKGRLRGERDIIWVSHNDLPEGQIGSRWLLFLTQYPDGSWKVLHGVDGLIRLKGDNTQVLAEVSKYVGAYGPESASFPTETDGEECALTATLGEGAGGGGDLHVWIKQAARGSQEARHKAYKKILASGEEGHLQLRALLENSERELAALARTLLPLTGGGPIVNGLRLVLSPEKMDLHVGELKNITVSLANVSPTDIKAVTGASVWGDNIQAASAYELRPVSGLAKDRLEARQAPLPVSMPDSYGAVRAGDAPLLPLIRVVPNFGVLSQAVELHLQNIDGKLRLTFPTGYIDLPGLGRYNLRVRFDCPGPRANQKRLIDENYWAGGQLVSNDIVLDIQSIQ